MIIHNTANDVTVAAHAIKVALNIKFTRAKERHASAMGFKSSNHLLAQLKNQAVQQPFNSYIEILTREAKMHHQIIISDAVAEHLRNELGA